LAVLHRQGERWRLLVAERRGALSILEARTLVGEPWAAVAEARERHGFERVVVVAPGRATVARCTGLPAGTSEEMAAAVSLMGEAQLPETLPSHRRAAGVVPDTERPGFRTALMTGWTPDAEATAPELPEALQDLRITWTTPVAALAALRGALGAALYADPNDGAVSMIAGGAERTFARVLVESPSGFWRSVAQVAGETAAAAGVPAPQVTLNAVGPALRLDPRSVETLKEDVHEMPDRAEWLNDYGIALGAAMVATSPDPLVRPLAGMLESAPVVREPALTRAVHWLAAPRNAWGVVAASVLVMLLSPLAFGAARLWLVNMKVKGGADSLMKAQSQSARQQVMIEQLGQSRWPMSKLFADVSDATPQGIVVESLRIATDQGVTIQGTAESAQLISVLQSNLNATKLFSNVKPNRIESTGNSVAFDISADVVHPYFDAKPSDDWAAKPLAVRLYGEGASNTATPSGGGSRRGGEATAAREGGRRGRERVADSGGSEGSDRSGGAERGDGGERRGGRGRDRGAERPSEASPKPAPANAADAPKPITDEQIKALDNISAMREMVSRRTFSQKAGLDSSTKGRLEDEVNRLKARLDQLRSGGGAGGATPAATGGTGATGATGATGSTGATGGKP
jgi:hypothetical protein